MSETKSNHKDVLEKLFQKAEKEQVWKKLEYLKAEIEKIYAIELLEYHDKNHLAGDNKSRSEVKQKQLQYALNLIEEIQNQNQ